MEGQTRNKRWLAWMCSVVIMGGVTVKAEAPSHTPDAEPTEKMETKRDVKATDAGEEKPVREEAPLPEFWFPVGEELTYRVYWGRIPVGRSVLSTEWVEEDGRTLLAIRAKTRSNRVIERIYPVDDRIESLVDPHTFLPVRFTMEQNAGRRESHEITEFDHENGVAHWKSLTREREEKVELEPGTRDLLSFAYYFRKIEFKPREKRTFRVMANDKIYDLYMQAGKVENVRLRHYGRVPSIEMEPEAAFEGLFERRGKMNFWVSRDDRRLMTRMVGSIPVASVRLILHRVRGPGNDAWILNGDDDDDDDDDED